MDQSRRAVQAYWRSRMIDEVTADEDKVAPVYKLEEVCELLRSAPAGVVKEVSDYILKRLDHGSPVVKQKALRLIKYAVGKSGDGFRREMQRNSAAVRQLFHYNGHVDPLKGDALNKAVRDAAHETIAFVFSTDDNKTSAPSPEGLGNRIEGFGNTNFQMAREDKKSFLSEVVGIGSASIKQSFSTFTATSSSRKNDSGSYNNPALRRSLTTEIDSRHEYQGDDLHRGSWPPSGASRTTAGSGTWGSDSRENINRDTAAASTDTSTSNVGSKSREERLLETVVTSGGVRLQPTRDALQAFLAEASKLDALSMSRALDVKLQSHFWQVRMKALCVLESILRKNDEEHFSIIASYFTENTDVVVRCTEFPQVSLREKVTKILGLLDNGSGVKEAVKPSNGRATDVVVVSMPSLIDTGVLADNKQNFEDDKQNSTQTLDDQNAVHLKQSGSLVDALFENDSLADLSKRDDNDPFSDVLFHTDKEIEQNDLFSGPVIDNRKFSRKVNTEVANKTDLTDVFGVNSEQLQKEAGNNKSNVNDLMVGLSLNSAVQNSEQHGVSGACEGDFSDVSFLNNSSQPKQPQAYGALNGNDDLNALYNQVSVHHNMPPNMMLNQNFASQPMNYGAMGVLIAQQQLLLQNLGGFHSSFVHKALNPMEDIYTSAFPDIFQLGSNPVQSHASVISNSKEETKAFDFISDHLAAARASKKIL